MRRPAARSLVLLPMLLLSACGSRDAAPEPAEQGGLEATSVFEGVEVVDRDPDGTLWRLRAAEGRAREQESSGELRGVEVEFHRRDRTLRLSAGTAVVERGENIRLSGGVAVTWDKYRAELQQAAYVSGKGTVTSDAPVLLTGPGLRVEGEGVEIDVEGRIVRVPKRARARLGGDTP